MINANIHRRNRVFNREDFEKKCTVLRELGLIDEEIEIIHLAFPEFFSLRESAMREKIETILESGLKDLMLINPCVLYQSAQLTKARLDYLDDIFHSDTEKIRHYVFWSSMHFQGKFRITSEQLIERYSLKYKI